MAKPNFSVADSTVVYQLSLLEQAINAPLLVVGYGSPMKACVKACVKNECSQIWVTGTKDKEKGFSCSGSARVALLGDKFDARLFTNVYAVIQAAKMCGAGALLVCDTNFVADPLLRMVAHQNAIPILLLLSMSQIGAVVPNARCTMTNSLFWLQAAYAPPVASCTVLLRASASHCCSTKVHSKNGTLPWKKAIRLSSPSSMS